MSLISRSSLDSPWYLTPSDVMLVKPDRASQCLLIEGDENRYHIPAAAIMVCEARLFYRGTEADNASPISGISPHGAHAADAGGDGRRLAGAYSAAQSGPLGPRDRSQPQPRTGRPGRSDRGLAPPSAARRVDEFTKCKKAAAGPADAEQPNSQE